MAGEFVASRKSHAIALAGSNFRVERRVLLDKGMPWFTLVKRTILHLMKAYLQSGLTGLATWSQLGAA